MLGEPLLEIFGEARVNLVGNDNLECKPSGDGVPFVAGEKTVARPPLFELRRAFFASCRRRRMAERVGEYPATAFSLEIKGLGQ